jgi:hypothetical protein
MARKFLEGLKGSIRKFVSPVSESRFGGDRLRFRDTGSLYLSMSFDNKSAIPTIDTDVLNLRGGNLFFDIKRQLFKTSETSVVNSYYQEFLPTIPSGYKMKNGTVRAKVNGLEQLSNGDQTVTASVDFMIDSTQKKVRIRKAQTGDDSSSGGNVGIDLTTGSHWDNPDTTGTPLGANKAGGGTGTGESDIIDVSFQLDRS